MEDRRILAAIVCLGAAALVVKAIEVGQHLNRLLRWHLDQEVIVVDTATNGGVRT